MSVSSFTHQGRHKRVDAIGSSNSKLFDDVTVAHCKLRLASYIHTDLTHYDSLPLVTLLNEVPCVRCHFATARINQRNKKDYSFLF